MSGHAFAGAHLRPRELMDRADPQIISDGGPHGDWPSRACGPEPVAAALGINDRGQIVGNSVFGQGVDDDGGIEDIVHAVLWDNGTIIDLGTLAGGQSGANDINNVGQIVAGSDGHAVVWSWAKATFG